MLQLIITLALVGFGLYLLERFVPMAQPIRLLIRVVVCVVIVLWLAQVFGLFSYDIPVQSLRRRS
jgi:hypothetical protein